MPITITRPAPTICPPAPAPADAGCYAAVNLSGRLRVLDAPAGGDGVFPIGRGTATGTVYRVDLDRGIACWLDSDHQHGEINWMATQICSALSRQPFTDPWGAPFVCGPVLFTAAHRTGSAPGGLDDAQLGRIADAHADAEDPDELPDGEQAQQWALALDRRPAPGR